MILLFGGTSETAPLCAAFATRGWSVLVSTATDAPLELPPGTRRRWGRLGVPELIELCRQEGIRVLVDATHPYAQEAHRTTREAALQLGIPHVRHERPVHIIPPEATVVPTHEEAARSAFALGGPVLLTTGSRHLVPYVREARRTGLPILARVLDHPESLRACREAGLIDGEIHAARGPFPMEATLDLLRSLQAHALVTKASGEAGGLSNKAEAARIAGAHLIVLEPPPRGGFDRSQLLRHLSNLLEAPHAPL